MEIDLPRRGTALRQPPHLSNVPDILGSTRYVVVDERDKLAEARAFARASGLDGTFVFDASGSIGQTWHSNTDVPLTYVIDGDGLIAARFDGAVTQAQLTGVTTALTPGKSWPELREQRVQCRHS